ncbi:Cation/H(+) antiporter 4 [Linum grandiflorum]
MDNSSTTGIHPDKIRLNISGECFEYIPAMSQGIWNMEYGESILKFPLVRFHVQLMIMLLLPYAFHSVLRFLYLPRITSEMLTGFILGPNVLQKLFPEIARLIFPPVINQAMNSLSKAGFIMFAFLSGVRMDPGLVKISGKKAVALGFAIFVIPFTMVHTCGVEYSPKSHRSLRIRYDNLKTTDIYLALITTSQFVGVNTVLMQLKITNTQLGHLALASTLISELLRFAYAFLLGYLEALVTIEPFVGVKILVVSILFAMFILGVLKSMVLWFIKKTPSGKPMNEIYIHIVIGVLMTLASSGDAAGVYYLFGPFLFGLVIPAGSPLATSVIAKLETTVSGIFMPMLLAYSSITFNMAMFIDTFGDRLNFQISVYGYIIKLVLTLLTCFACKMGVRDSVAFSLIVNSKGVLEVASMLSFSGLSAGEPDATSAILLVFIASSIIPPLIKLLYDPSKQYVGYKKKCVQFASQNSELPVLVCAHKQEDAVAALKMLEFWNPTRQSPLTITGLCLQELVSSYTPQLINHQLGQKITDSEAAVDSHAQHRGSNNHGSQPIVNVFNYFKTEFKKLVQINAFTAISPLKLMYEDICWISFDKAVCIVILPFHKKWNAKGQMIHESSELRSLNCTVLERAPCSVGILIDRRTNHGINSMFVSSPVYRVAVLFFGGADDRESLAIGGRMSGNPRVKLTVMRFRGEEEEFVARNNQSWDEVFDEESMRMLRQDAAEGGDHVKFVEHKVRDGSDTSRIVHSLGDGFDLVIVGRRHEDDMEALSGLATWSELPELGVVGDILAGAEMNSSVSVLVVQQQIMQTSHSSVLNS